MTSLSVGLVGRATARVTSRGLLILELRCSRCHGVAAIDMLRDDSARTLLGVVGLSCPTVLLFGASDELGCLTPNGADTALDHARPCILQYYLLR